MKLFIVAAAAAAATMAACSTTTSPAPPPATYPLQRQLEAAASGTGALAHLRKLQRMADENGGNRTSPGPGYDASVDYVAGVLRKAGWNVSTPQFDVEGDRIRNVIAQTKTGDPDQVVMSGAHLDSVPDGPGMNDNGSGSAALLEFAVRMGGSPEVTNQVRLAWWGAEEVDMDGSTHYVETLSRADRRKIALYLNLDMVASPNVGYLVEGKGGCDEDAADGSTEVARVLAERLTATGVTPEIIEFMCDSDYMPFMTPAYRPPGPSQATTRRRPAGRLAVGAGKRAMTSIPATTKHAMGWITSTYRRWTATQTPSRGPLLTSQYRSRVFRPVTSWDPRQRRSRVQDYGCHQDFRSRVQRPWRRWIWRPLTIRPSRDSWAVKAASCGWKWISASWWSSHSPTRGNQAL
jgi:aminopeptidase S